MFNHKPFWAGLALVALSTVSLIGCSTRTAALGGEKSEISHDVKLVLEPALQTWDPSGLVKRYMPNALREENVARDTKKFAEAKEKFGKFVSLGEGEMVRRDPNDQGLTAYATPILRYKGEFEKGPANVEVWVRVAKKKEDWVVDHFKVEDPLPTY